MHARIGEATRAEQPLSATSGARFPCRCRAGDLVDVDLGVRLDAAYQVDGESLLPLPSGATCDPARGRFTWRTPLSPLGTSHFVFPSAGERIDLVVTVANPTDARAVAVHVDTPGAGASVTGPFVIAGWTFDPLAESGTGVTDVAVTIRRDEAGDAPVFTGVATTGGVRADVADTFGEQFEASGFTLTVPALPSGAFQIALRPRTRSSRRPIEAIVRISSVPARL